MSRTFRGVARPHTHAANITKRPSNLGMLLAAAVAGLTAAASILLTLVRGLPSVFDTFGPSNLAHSFPTISLYLRLIQAFLSTNLVSH